MTYERRKDDVNNLPHMANFRDELRKEMTPAEARLWTMLSNSKFEGRKFRRQHSIGNYILDFYCPSEKLAIELDGAGHFTGKGAEYDRVRKAYLETKGIRVVRFENKLVFEEWEFIADSIRDNFRFGPPVKTLVYGRGKYSKS